jgi:hypothetical protein
MFNYVYTYIEKKNHCEPYVPVYYQARVLCPCQVLVRRHPISDAYVQRSTCTTFGGGRIQEDGVSTFK